MTLSTFECIASITEHSAGFAQAARVDLGGRVEHCPEWSVADLVWHLTEVHWFWATIAEERPGSPPEEFRRPPRGSDDELVDDFVAGAARLVQVLRDADQNASCWTWAPSQQDVAFITRHQVQETAVHHWDAVHAAGGSLIIEDDVAVDAVEEFLTFSVSSDADPADPPQPPLDGRLGLRAVGTDAAWTLTDGRTPGTVALERGAADVLTVEATASDLLLWLYGRTEVDESAVDADLLARFRGLCFTD